MMARHCAGEVKAKLIEPHKVLLEIDSNRFRLPRNQESLGLTRVNKADSVHCECYVAPKFRFRFESSHEVRKLTCKTRHHVIHIVYKLFARLCVTAAAVGIFKETLELGDQIASGEGPTGLFGAFLRQRTRAEMWIRTILAGIVCARKV